MDSVAHLLLYKHVILHPALEYFGSLATILSDPSRVSLFIEVGVRYLLDIHEDVIYWLVAIVDDACVVIEMQTTYRAPVYALLLIELEVEIAVAEDVVFVVYHFYFSLLKIFAIYVFFIRHHFLIIQI